MVTPTWFAPTGEPVPGFDGYYVTSTGRVWSTRSYRGTSGRWLTDYPSPKGYRLVNLQRGGKPNPRRIHQLVLEAWVGERPEGMTPRHLDGNPANNNLSNLRWGTQSENIKDAVRHGTHPSTRKTHCPAGHPYLGENLYVTPQGWRACRACRSRSDR